MMLPSNLHSTERHISLKADISNLKFQIKSPRRHDENGDAYENCFYVTNLNKQIS